MARVYLDSNVFISLIQDEFGKKFEFMSYRTEEFFDRVLSCIHTIVISTAAIREIEKITLLSEHELKHQLSKYEDKITFVDFTRTDLEKAKEFNKIHKIGNMDSLHILLAKKEKCDCIVSYSFLSFFSNSSNNFSFSSFVRNGVFILAPLLLDFFFSADISCQNICFLNSMIILLTASLTNSAFEE
ncbi:MAG: PIN domain-containing protein [Nanoarchaeota archaeon]|nr:PIN domain-containing protein [Nanoarchaeota archaeon]